MPLDTDGKQFFKVLKNGLRKQIWLTDGASNWMSCQQKLKYYFRRT
jgi:hypothetical protein